jgi:hypothetical protein
VKNILFIWLKVKRFIAMVGVNKSKKTERNKKQAQTREFIIIQMELEINGNSKFKLRNHFMKKANEVMNTCKIITKVKFEFRIW